MRIGIAFDLKSDFQVGGTAPDDRLEEYDSDETVGHLTQALEALGHSVVRLGGGRRLVERVLADPPDLVYNIAEGYGTRSREAHVPAVLEMLGIPFTHSDPLTLAVTLDKAMAKRLVAAAGLSTPPFKVVSRLQDLDTLDLPFPVITKPLWEGSSMGIRLDSRHAHMDSLRKMVADLLADYQQPVLVEAFCTGPEFTVGVLGNGADARVLGTMEIQPRNRSLEHFVYSVEVKRNYAQEVVYHVPPPRPRAMVDRVEALALACYRELGCRDQSRVDIRLDAEGEPRFIEVNPLPGMNAVTGDIVLIAKGMGLTYTQLVGQVVAAATARLGLP